MFGRAERKSTIRRDLWVLFIAKGVMERCLSGLPRRELDTEKLTFYKSAEQVSDKEGAFQQSW